MREREREREREGESVRGKQGYIEKECGINSERARERKRERERERTKQTYKFSPLDTGPEPSGEGETRWKK